MDCPHCKKSISVFSQEMNRFGKPMTCSHCRGSVKMFISLEWVAILFVPSVVLALLLRPWLGALSTGLTIAAMVLLAMRLESAP